MKRFFVFCFLLIAVAGYSQWMYQKQVDPLTDQIREMVYVKDTTGEIFLCFGEESDTGKTFMFIVWDEPMEGAEGLCRFDKGEIELLTYVLILDEVVFIDASLFERVKECSVFVVRGLSASGDLKTAIFELQ